MWKGVGYAYLRAAAAPSKGRHASEPGPVVCQAKGWGAGAVPQATGAVHLPETLWLQVTDNDPEQREKELDLLGRHEQDRRGSKGPSLEKSQKHPDVSWQAAAIEGWLVAS